MTKKAVIDALYVLSIIAIGWIIGAMSEYYMAQQPIKTRAVMDRFGYVFCYRDGQKPWRPEFDIRGMVSCDRSGTDTVFKQ